MCIVIGGELGVLRNEYTEIKVCFLSSFLLLYKMWVKNYSSL